MARRGSAPTLEFRVAQAAADPATPAAIRALAEACLLQGDVHPSWSPAEFDRLGGPRILLTTMWLRLEGWATLRGPEACLTLCLAAAIVEADHGRP